MLEEILFRAIVFGLYRDAGVFAAHPALCVAFLPLFFAVAHVHAFFF
jgi:hypothetical protein